MLEFLYRGGMLMIPIGLCSVIAFALTIERCWVFWNEYTSFERFWDSVSEELDSGNMDRALEIAKSHDGLIPDLVVQGLSSDQYEAETVSQRMEDYGTELIPHLERSLASLNIIAQIAPLLGLLGTVAGMIDVFSVISSAGMANADLMAGGIFKALTTTAAGLSVGIPTLVAFHLLSRQVDRFLHQMEISTRRLQAYVNDMDG